MKARKIILLLMFFMITGIVRSQEVNIGINAGVEAQYFFAGRPDFTSYSLELNAEYTPFNAMFSLSQGVQYFFNQKIMCFPVFLNLKPGKRIKVNFGIGPLPVLRFMPDKPNKTFTLGGNAGFGIEYKLKQKIIIQSNFHFYYVPVFEYQHSHFGDISVDRNIQKQQYLSFGIKYVIHP